MTLLHCDRCGWSGSESNLQPPRGGDITRLSLHDQCPGCQHDRPYLRDISLSHAELLDSVALQLKRKQVNRDYWQGVVKCARVELARAMSQLDLAAKECEALEHELARLDVAEDTV